MQLIYTNDKGEITTKIEIVIGGSIRRKTGQRAAGDDGHEYEILNDGAGIFLSKAAILE
jgi:tRNA(Ile2) C34 agmatinyltransferase TiaS